jgi:hypothetical protein
MSKIIAAAAVALLAVTACCASPTYWDVDLISDYSAGYLKVGARRTATDGYDGQPVGDPSQAQYGVCLALYRENGPDWTGPTGLYGRDFMTPIPPVPVGLGAISACGRSTRSSTQAARLE